MRANCEPGACKYPIFLSRRFHKPIYFQLNLSRIQIPTRTSVNNCSHKHGLMSIVDMFTWDNIVLFLPKRAHVDWNWPILQEKYISKNRPVCKNAVALANYGTCRLLVMSSCFFIFTTDIDLSLVHTTPEEFQNASLFFGLGLPSTLINPSRKQNL